MRKTMIKTQGMRPGFEIPYRPCLHVQKGRTMIAKTCIHGYECWHCAFDQWIEEMEEGQKIREGFKSPRDTLARAA